LEISRRGLYGWSATLGGQREGRLDGGVKDHGQMATPTDPTLATIDVALSARVAEPLARERAPDHIVRGCEATAGAVGLGRPYR